MKSKFISVVVLTGLLTFSVFAQSETKEEKKVRKSGITTKKKQVK